MKMSDKSIPVDIGLLRADILGKQFTVRVLGQDSNDVKIAEDDKESLIGLTFMENENIRRRMK